VWVLLLLLCARADDALRRLFVLIVAVEKKERINNTRTRTHHTQRSALARSTFR
jgi:hypothetical protein